MPLGCPPMEIVGVDSLIIENTGEAEPTSSHMGK